MEEIEHITDQDITEQEEQERNRETERDKREKLTYSRVEGQNRGGLGQIRCLGKNQRQGRTHRVDKVDTEANSQDGKTGDLEGSWLRGG